MLMGIPSAISPELMMTLMQMGHGDMLAIGDGNFPAFSIARHTSAERLIRLEGVGIPEILDAILTLMPLDYAVDHPARCMAAPAEAGPQPIHAIYEQLLSKHGYGEGTLAMLPRFPFYEEAKRGFAVLITGESARFANIILTKGVVKPAP